MKRQIIAVAIGSLFALPAFADGEIGFDFRTVTPAESTKTRAQVRAELIAYQRSGDYFVANTGLKAYQLFPSFYPTPAARAGKSRDEVLAELLESQRSGYFVVDGELGLKANQVSPNAYPQQRLAGGEQKRRM